MTTQSDTPIVLVRKPRRRSRSRSRRGRSSDHSAALAAVVIFLLAWGVLVFASVYRWASIPLAAGCSVFGAWALIRPRRPLNGAMRALLIACVVLACAVGLQLVPLSLSLLEKISPATLTFLQKYSIAYPSYQRHAISLQPYDTAFALGLFVAFALFMLGLGRALSTRTAETIAIGVAALGVLVAMEGVVQRTISTETIYGFWVPQSARVVTFGPFVNRNHFAGWMLMALSLTIGYLFATIERHPVASVSGWRRRIVWLGSPDASPALAAGAAVGVMAVVLVLTLSRSGIACFVAVIAIWAFVTNRRSASGSSGVAAIAYFLLIALVSAVWIGMSNVSARFDNLGVNDASRLLAWRDALNVVMAFPLAGTGVNAYDTALLFYDSGTTGKFFGQVHNDYLQLAAEGGLLVGIPAIGVVVAFVAAVRRRFRNDERPANWLRLGAVTGLIAIALQEAVDFSLQIPGNAVLFATLGAIALHRSASRAPQSDSRLKSSAPLELVVQRAPEASRGLAPTPFDRQQYGRAAERPAAGPARENDDA